MLPVRYWNSVALQLNAIDHSGALAPLEQGGPVRSARVLALLHIAIHDVVAIVSEAFSPVVVQADGGHFGTDMASAIAGASRTVLSALYPRQAEIIEGHYRVALTPNADPNAVIFGEEVAREILLERSDDEYQGPSSYKYVDRPGAHRPDPFSPNQLAYAPDWGRTKAYSFSSANRPGLKPPPSLSSVEYGAAFNEVKTTGEAGLLHRDPTGGTVGVSWAYDGTSGLGTPTRLFNQVLGEVVSSQEMSTLEEARLYALVNVGLADAGVACWYYKYLYNVWRPVVAVREADFGYGPSGIGDQNDRTSADPFWAPYGAPDTNGSRRLNFTPGFPAYPSGHSVFGATAFKLIGRYFKSPLSEIKFTFRSDEFNGANRDAQGVVRPKLTRKLTLEDALRENGESRVFLGVHWRFDITGGEELGAAVEEMVHEFFGRPTHPRPYRF